MESPSTTDYSETLQSELQKLKHELKVGKESAIDSAALQKELKALEQVLLDKTNENVQNALRNAMEELEASKPRTISPFEPIPNEQEPGPESLEEVKPKEEVLTAGTTIEPTPSTTKPSSPKMLLSRTGSGSKYQESLQQVSANTEENAAEIAVVRGQIGSLQRQVKTKLEKMLKELRDESRTENKALCEKIAKSVKDQVTQVTKGQVKA